MSVLIYFHLHIIYILDSHNAVKQFHTNTPGQRGKYTISGKRKAFYVNCFILMYILFTFYLGIMHSNTFIQTHTLGQRENE